LPSLAVVYCGRSTDPRESQFEDTLDNSELRCLHSTNSVKACNLLKV